MNRLAMLATLVVSVPCVADTLHIKDSDALIDCTVIRETPKEVMYIYRRGLMTMARENVEKIDRTAVRADAKPAVGDARAPGWEVCIAKLAAQPWATSIEQHSAVVIEEGTMRNVPYRSFQIGKDYEMNVYGDPDAPTAIEVGFQHGVVVQPEDQTRCKNLVADLLPDGGDVRALMGLENAGGSATRDGVTFEVKPPAAEGSRGGWWVSVYNKEKLDGVRASDDDMKAITETDPASKAADLTNKPPPSTQHTTSSGPSSGGGGGGSGRSSAGGRGGGGPVIPVFQARRIYRYVYVRRNGRYVLAPVVQLDNVH